jgi:hypothetical protein
MRALAALVLALILGACGGSTETQATRYNFGIVDGSNQKSTAGTATLAKPITSQLTRDPQGKFATRVFDFFAPAIAYAQSLTLPGDPIADAIVCGRESAPGEPKVVPLCAFTLADGKAANTVEPGTKAGSYNIVFTAQVASELPVKDSTTVTVEPGPAVNPTNQPAGGGWDQPRLVRVGESITIVPVIDARDQYGNAIPDYAKTAATGLAARNGSEPGEVTPDVTGTLTYIVEPKWAVTADGTVCERLPCRVYLYFWVGIFRGMGTLDVQ